MSDLKPILIADFDGVLNAHGGTGKGVLCDPANVAAFNHVIAETGASIVVCSMWRYLVHNGYMTIAGLNRLLQSHGVQGQVIDVTRPSQDSFNSEDDSDIYEPRWKQIADWLKRPSFKFSRYAIVDDDPHAFGGRPGVQTNGAVGITWSDAKSLVAILKGEQ